MKMFAKSIVGRNCRTFARLALMPLLVLPFAQQSRAVDGITEGALQQISALQAEKASRAPAQIKMDSQLVYALKRSRGQAYAPGVTNLVLGVTVAGDGTVLVDLDAQVNQALLGAIQQAGGNVRFSSQRFSSIRATLPL